MNSADRPIRGIRGIRKTNDINGMGAMMELGPLGLHSGVPKSHVHRRTLLVLPVEPKTTILAALTPSNNRCVMTAYLDLDRRRMGKSRQSFRSRSAARSVRMTGRYARPFCLPRGRRLDRKPPAQPISGCHLPALDPAEWVRDGVLRRLFEVGARPRSGWKGSTTMKSSA